MKTIVVFNQKGGVGKTSTVINMMSELSLRHKKVLAIDLDAQCNLTSFCGFKYSKYSVVDWLLSDKLKLDFVVCNTKYGDLIPADERLHMEMLKFASMPAFVIRIKNLLVNLKEYDYVVIDCPPTVNQLTAAALVAADYVLIPTETEFFSAAGIEMIAQTIEQIKPLTPALKVLGVLIVKYQANRTLTRAIEQKLNATIKKYLDCDLLKTKIRFTVDVPAAQASGLSVKDYKTKSNSAVDYAEFVEEIWQIIK